MSREKICQFCWVAYLALAGPLMGLCLFGIYLMGVGAWDDIGPLEFPPPSRLENWLSVPLLFTTPPAWFFSLLTAHRFDRPGRRFIPFLVNLPSALSLFILPLLHLQDAEPWLLVYSISLLPLLLTGLAAVTLPAGHSGRGIEPNEVG